MHVNNNSELVPACEESVIVIPNGFAVHQLVLLYTNLLCSEWTNVSHIDLFGVKERSANVGQGTGYIFRTCKNDCVFVLNDNILYTCM